MSYILQKYLATGKPVAKILIKFNNNGSEKWRIGEGTNWSRFYQTKSWSWNDENAFDFKWSGVQEEDEEDIALANFIENLQKQTNEKIFPKK